MRRRSDVAFLTSEQRRSDVRGCRSDVGFLTHATWKQPKSDELERRRSDVRTTSKCLLGILCKTERYRSQLVRTSIRLSLYPSIYITLCMSLLYKGIELERHIALAQFIVPEDVQRQSFSLNGQKLTFWDFKIGKFTHFCLTSRLCARHFCIEQS